MPQNTASRRALTFYLNEQHELSRGEKETGGSLPKLAEIDWRAKGKRLGGTLGEARKSIQASEDPLRQSRYFLATAPAKKIVKRSENIRRAKDGIVEEPVDFAGEHSRVFKRLGMDLISVEANGQALVHASAARVDQLLATVSSLEEEGLRERSRWIAIDSFQPTPASFRVDEEWLVRLKKRTLVDSVVELQPLLTRLEVEQVMQAIVESLRIRNNKERFHRMGTDFSGRHWYRGALSLETLRHIAEKFYSVQALHPPLQTEVALVRSAAPPSSHRSSAPPIQIDPTLMPVVAVVDVGVPASHSKLAPYRRGSYIAPGVPSGLVTDHGSLVASRVVFGNPDFSTGVHPVTGNCAFLDVNIAETNESIDDKSLLTALQTVVSAYPDVRVFNLSIGDYKTLSQYPPTERKEKLQLLRDLDNFAFQSDVIIVVAAGNSLPGLQPSQAYPDHFNDADWGLASWACGFNTLTCGSFVDRLAPGGLVTDVGWPSPFSRIGPGLCNSPVPDFSAAGGNCTPQFQNAVGLGVWATTASGMWEDHYGTSMAAPLLAREAAFTLKELQSRCEQGARPFACIVRAFLGLSARLPAEYPVRVQPLVERTLGRGIGSSSRLRSPDQESAVLLWQGVLGSDQDKARIQIPIPRSWLKAASRPTLRVVGGWESPVNDAAAHVWASRKVEIQLRPNPSGRAIPSSRTSHPSYPLLDRSFDLTPSRLKARGISLPDGETWILEVSYREIAAYSAIVEVSPQQRVGIALELLDDSEDPESPQSAMQSLPQIHTMNRLSVPENRVSNPIFVRPRV